MADEVAVLLVRLEAQISQFERTMARAEGRSVQAKNRIEGTFAALNRTISANFAALGLSFGGAFLANFIKQSVEAGAKIADTAAQIGISAEALQELSFVADQSGSSMDALTTAFKGMTVFLGEVARKSNTAEAELANLGLTFEDLKGKTPDQAFEILVDRISRIKDPTLRNAEALQVFKKSAAELGTVTQMTAKEIDDMRREARDKGLIASNEDIERLKRLNDQIAKLGSFAQTAGIKLGAGFAPIVESFINAVTSPAALKAVDALAGAVRDFASSGDDLELSLTNLVNSPAWIEFWRGFNNPNRPAGPVTPRTGNPLEQFFGGLFGTGTPQGQGTPTTTGPDFESRFFAPTAPITPALDAAIKAKRAQLAAEKTAPTGGETPPPNDPAEIQRWKDLAAAIELETKNLTASRKEQFIANEVAKLGSDATPEHVANIKALAGALYDQQQAQKAVNDATEFFSETAFDAFDKLITGAESFKAVLADVLKALERAVLQSLLLGQGPLAGLFGTSPTGNLNVGGIFGFLGSLFGARQSGGPVMPGRGYLVGERGPELFMPNVSGQIIPNEHAGGPAPLQVHVIPSAYFDVTVDQRSAVQAQKISVEVVRTTGKAQARRRELSE